MERRAYHRQPLSLEVTLKHRGTETHRCQVRDFCRGGMFIEIPNTPRGHPAPSPGRLIEIRFVDPRSGTRRGHRLLARVARAFDAGIGVSLADPDVEALQVLEQLARDQALAQQHARRPMAHILAPYLRQVQEHIEERLAELFPSAESHLFEEADGATNDQESRRYVDAIPALRRSRSMFEASFRKTLERRISHVEPRPEEHEPDAEGGGSLSLVEQDDFEDWLSISELITRAEFHHRAQLHGLAHRLSALLGGQSLDNEHNPIGPATIFGALREAVQPLFADPAVRRVLYRAFDEVVMAPLGGVYEEVNQKLIAAGVLPTLPSAARGARASGGSTVPLGALPQTATTDGTLSGTADDGAIADGYAFAASLLGLPSARVAGASPEAQAPIAEGASAFDGHGLQDVLAAMAELMARQPTADLGAGEGSPHINLQQVLREALDRDGSAADGRRALGQRELAAVSATEAILNTTLNSVGPSAEAQGWIAGLALPLLKLALLKPLALGDAQHPARRLLNQLGSLSLAPGGQSTKLHASLQQAINQAAHRHDDQDAVFADLAAVLEPLLAVQDAAFARNVERVVNACDGADRLRRARRRVASEVRQRFPDERLPPEIEALLEVGWSQLLVLVYLRDGIPSDAWDGLMAVTERLRHRLEQDGTDGDDNTLILAAMDEGLASVSAAPARRAAFMDAMARRLAGDAAAFVNYLATYPNVLAEAPVAAAAARTVTPAGHVDPVALLQIGDWVLFPGRPVGQQRLRLTWIDQDHDSLVFVDHRGLKAAELRGGEVAEQIGNGRAVVLQGTELPLVDRSMYLMVQSLHDKLAYQAGHDELTGLLNRPELERRLQAALLRAWQHGVPSVVTYLDLDQFKIINHSCGYQVGDELLQEVGQLLQNQAGSGMTLARLGGDEFCTLVENCGSAEAYDFAERQRLAVQEYRFVRDGQHFSLSASIGMVVVSATSTSVSDILGAADAACYTAKDSGRNRVQIYEAEDADIARRRERLEWVARLNKALDQNLLRLRCQRIAPVAPVVKAAPHYEMLIGMQSENGGLILPGQFMPAAEIYSRMGAVDRWVVSRVLSWMADNRERLDGLDGFSVNLSGQSLNDPSFLQFVVGLLKTTKVPTSKLCFEITETVAIVNFDRAIQFMRRVRELGCRFSLDDFGSGQSSYSYLRNLPVDYLKIDGMFVRNIATDENDYALVKSINDIAHFMGKRTIAEYVESEAILHRLREIGVDYAQGNGIHAAQAFSEVFH